MRVGHLESMRLPSPVDQFSEGCDNCITIYTTSIQGDSLKVNTYFAGDYPQVVKS